MGLLQPARVVAAIRDWAKQYRILFTPKALDEMRDLGVNREDVRDVLLDLTSEEFFRRIRSRLSNEWLYEFKASLVGTLVYCKVALRNGCVLISFHEDDNDEEDDDAV